MYIEKFSSYTKKRDHHWPS